MDKFDTEKYTTTLKETSKDDNGNFVLDSQYTVYDFDMLTEDLTKYHIGKSGKKKHSSDALFIKNKDNIYFIEFKNTRKDYIKKGWVRQKAYDSLWPLQLAFFPNYSLKEISERLVYIVVYNDAAVLEKNNQTNDSPSFQNLKSGIKSWITKDTQVCSTQVWWELDDFVGLLFKEVHTIDREIFKKNYEEKIFN